MNEWGGRDVWGVGGGMQMKHTGYLRRAGALAASSAACRLLEPGREFFSGPGDPRRPGGSAGL